jgi:hypothetical protein
LQKVPFFSEMGVFTQTKGQVLQAWKKKNPRGHVKPQTNQPEGL